MSSPRNLYPNTTVFATCRCVHQSFRLVPKPVVRRIVDFCFGVVSSRYREETGMEFYEFEFISTHYNLVANNGTGCITDFLQDLNALIARELNSLRGTSGAFFDRDPGIQTVVGGGRVFPSPCAARPSSPPSTTPGSPCPCRRCPAPPPPLPSPPRGTAAAAAPRRTRCPSG